MTQKDLLLKDLCARLYTCNCINGTALIVALTDEQPLESNQWLISNYDCYKDKFIVSNIVYASDEERHVDIDNIRPYLFPLSSMTEEQFEELKDFADLKYEGNTLELVKWNDNCTTLDFWLEEIPSQYIIKVFDWLNKNHFDYRGLIPMGLANDATGKSIY